MYHKGSFPLRASNEAFFVCFSVFYFFPRLSSKRRKKISIKKTKNTSFHTRTRNEP